MRLSRHLPCTATLANAGVGLIACALAVNDRPEFAALMIVAAVLLDSMDGALARSLNAESRLGAELDSLADVISFGVAPAILVGTMLPPGLQRLGWALVLIYPLCAAFRLARFNAMHDAGEEDHGEFVGLPSTGAGCAVATLVLLATHVSDGGMSVSPLTVPCIMVALGLLMVSPISYGHAGNWVGRLPTRVAFILGATLVAGSIFWCYQYVFAAVAWGYTVSGPLIAATQKVRALHHA
jgi:CDP-diacylglycerol--serine O-phosphatidyltransferase